MSKNKQESKPAVQVKQLTLWEKIVRHRILILMCLPAIIYFIAFSYAPLPGIWVAFVKYNYRDGIFGSKFIISFPICRTIEVQQIRCFSLAAPLVALVCLPLDFSSACPAF